VLQVVADSALGRTWTSLPLHLAKPVELCVEPAVEYLPAGNDLLARVTARLAGDGQSVADDVTWEVRAAAGLLASGQAAVPADGAALLRIPLAAELSPQNLWLTVTDGTAHDARRVRLDAPLDGSLPTRLDSADTYVVAGQSVRGAVTALTPDGLPAAGAAADVEVRVAGRSAAAHGSLDDTGRWDFSLSVPDFEARRAGAVLTARVHARDGRGGWSETHLPAAAEPLLLSVAAAAPALVAEADNTLTVLARRPDGTPVRTDISAWFDDDKAAELRSDSEGRAVLVVQPRAGVNSLRLRAAADGQNVTRDEAMPAVAADGALALSVEAVADAAVVRVQAPGPVRGPVYVDLLQGGQIVTTRSLGLSRGHGSLILALPRGVSGALAVRAYAPVARTGWRVGWAWLDVPGSATLKLTATRSGRTEEGDEARLTVSAADPAGAVEKQVWLISEPRGPAVAAPPSEAPAPADEAPPSTAPFALAANSYHEAHGRAVARQRAFFARSTLIGASLGALLLLAVALAVITAFTDPFEYVSRAERRAWGKVPQVHRRGAWAGYGALAAAALAAVIMTAVVGLAGRQAQQLAGLGREALIDWRPVARPWASFAAQSLAAAVADTAVDGGRFFGPGRCEVLATGADGFALAPWPNAAAAWQARAEALDADGAWVCATVAPPPPTRLGLSLDAPRTLRVGDRLALPLIVVNPFDLPLPLVVRASVEKDLELTAAPTQHVVLPRGGRVALTVPLLAAEPGRAKLVITAEGHGQAESVEAEVDIVPPLHRVVTYRFGRRFEAAVPLSLPPGAAARTVDVVLAADGTQPLDDALAAVAGHEPETAEEAAAAVEAAALRCRLSQDAGTLTEERRVLLVPPLVRACQRLLVWQAHDSAGALTGGFSAQPGAMPRTLPTARVVTALRAAAAFTPVDETLLRRAVSWLAARHRAGQGWPADGPSPSIEPSEAGLRAGAEALVALTGRDDEKDLVEAAAGELARRLPAAHDACTLSLVAAALTAAGHGREAGAALDKLAAAATDHDGLASWPGGAAIETTARAVAALTGSGGSKGELARHGAAWLARQALSDGTWGPARATVPAVRALAAVDPPAPAARGSVSVLLDGAERGAATLDEKTPHGTIALSPGPGDHTLRLAFSGRGRPSWQVRLGYSRAAAPTEPSGFTAMVTFDHAKVAPGAVLAVTVRVRNTDSQTVSGVEARLPLPPGFVPAEPDGPPHDDTLSVPIGTMAPNEVREATVRLRAVTPAADITPGEAEIRAADDPGRVQPVTLPKLAVG